MAVQNDEFDTLKRNALEIINEIELHTRHENLVRECVRVESRRADASASASEAARRAASDARADTAAARARAYAARKEHDVATNQLVAARMQLAIIERERTLLERRCSELSQQADRLQQELQWLSSAPSALKALQRSYGELEARMKRVIEEAQLEQSRLRDEFTSVESSCVGSVELRERACRAASAHARDRRLADAEYRQASEELQKANAEIAHLKAALEQQQQHRVDRTEEDSIAKALEDEKRVVFELQAELTNGKADTERLEKALSAVVADNVALAVRLAAIDNRDRDSSLSSDIAPEITLATNMTAVDSFLNEL